MGLGSSPSNLIRDFPLATSGSGMGIADILVEGQQLAWWGMDIAEIRWMIVEVLRGNFVGFGVLAAFIALAAFYFKAQKKEEQEAAVRMGWTAEE